ncbi:hypothetical protein [Mariniradius saccharolyticus]|uniref:hypothetical protein n=1 Tax=Mariniradius saccharolyticus TaxID=1245591 RepID=UPI00146144AF|nr:hypothetical protein [Mariniradius saccharolyticus]
MKKGSLSPELYARKRVKPSFVIPRNEESIAVLSDRKSPLHDINRDRCDKGKLIPELYARKRVKPSFVIPRNEESTVVHSNRKTPLHDINRDRGEKGKPIPRTLRQKKGEAILCHSEFLKFGIYRNEMTTDSNPHRGVEP